MSVYYRVKNANGSELRNFIGDMRAMKEVYMKPEAVVTLSEFYEEQVAAANMAPEATLNNAQAQPAGAQTPSLEEPAIDVSQIVATPPGVMVNPTVPTPTMPEPAPVAESVTTATINPTPQEQGNEPQQVKMEDEPAVPLNESIVGPNVEEINKLRAIISAVSLKISKLTDELDELQQVMQEVLVNRPELAPEASQGMKM